MKSEDDIINELAAHVGEVAAQNYRDLLPDYKRSESPIERVLLAAFLANPIDGVYFSERAEAIYDPIIVLRVAWEGSTDYAGQLIQQARIGNYRADFYLEAFDVIDPGPDATVAPKPWIRLVIECDGHDFHERTKEQARSDKRRDRWFQTHGISVLRFAGSEIWADPLGCVDQIHDAFFAAWRRTHGRGD